MTRSLPTRMILEKPVRQPDGGGGWTLGWQPLGFLWADLRAVSAREIAIGDRPAARVTHRITIRLSPDISARPAADQRLRRGDRVYAIRGVAEADGARAHLTIWAEEGPVS